MAESAQTPSTFEGLVALVARLRAPDGCPWDRDQTHASLRRALLEECYEALEALDAGDSAALAEELGDVLVHVAFHCQMAAETGDFTARTVLQGAIEKLVRRHPHVFADAQVQSVQDVEEQWEALKREERRGGSALEGAPRSMPALAYCQTISRRAARAGFEWPDLSGVLDKLREELDELQAAQTDAEREHEMGDVLFSLANVARWIGVDAESALRSANLRFSRRFAHMEEASRRRSVAFESLSPEAKEALWQQAKADLG